jgi:iron complex outermembrane recepter protein
VQATAAGVNRLILRGLSSGPNDLTGTVGVYGDDVPFGSSTGVSLSSLLSPDMDPFELQRVEVLRGPQGTLYGASTLGGLVKYVHRSPDLHSYQGSMRLNGGFVDESRAPFSGSARLAVNAPLIDGKLVVEPVASTLY